MSEDIAEIRELPKGEIESQGLIKDLQLLEHPLKPDFRTEEVIGALDNPVRGKVDKGKIKFSDLTWKKIGRLWELVEMARRDERVEEVVDILWGVAISDNPGPDVSWKALRFLEQLPRIPAVFREKLETIWRDEPDFKTACFAARVLNFYGGRAKNPSMEETIRFQELTDSAPFWNPRLVEDIIKNTARSFSGDEKTYISLVLYRCLQEELTQRDHAPRLDKAAQQGLASAIKRINAVQKRFKRLKLGRSFVSLGTELQGDRARNIPKVAESGKFLYSSLGPFNYYDLMALAGFTPSYDRLWEFALPPSENPRIQALIIQQLHRLDFISSERVATSLHITIGGLKSSETHREAAALQLMMLGAGDVTDSARLIEKNARQTWCVWSGKMALRRRSIAELETTRSQAHKVAAEMRMTALTDLPNTYRALLTLPILAAAAKEYQAKIDGQTFSSKLSGYWDSLVGEINETFSDFNLPSTTKIWTFHELEKLKKLLESDKGEEFSQRIRGILGRHRLKITPVLEQEEVSLERAEEKSLNVLLQTVREWKSACGEKLLNKKHLRSFSETDREVLELLVSVRRYALTIPVSLCLVNMARGASSENAIRMGLLFLIPFLITNPDLLAKVPATIKALLKRKPNLEPRKVIQDLNAFCIGVDVAALSLASSTAGERERMELLFGALAIYGVGYLGKKLLRSYEAIESYEL